MLHDARLLIERGEAHPRTEAQPSESHEPHQQSANAQSAAPPTQVPLLDLKLQYQPLQKDILAAVEKVCASQAFILGPATTVEEGVRRFVDWYLDYYQKR